MSHLHFIAGSRQTCARLLCFAYRGTILIKPKEDENNEASNENRPAVEAELPAWMLGKVPGLGE